MATWTPNDLRSTEFVRTQLSPLDRSNALLTMNQNLTSVQSRLDQNKAALEQVQNETNGPYSFGTVRDARRAAQEAQTAGAPNAAALQSQYEELAAKRSELNAQADKLLRNVQSGEEAIQTSQIAISNLEAAGAVPPGTNQFTPPPGYTQPNNTLTPPSQVPNSQNPNPTPSDPNNENVTNPIPLSTDSFGAGTQAEAEAIQAEEQRQVEFDLGATQGEIDAIRAEEQRQLEFDLGATQDEADFLIQAQKEADQQEYETQLGATQAEADAIVQAQREANANEFAFGGTQNEADFLIQAQREADANEFAFGGTQTEADFLIQAQREANANEFAFGGTQAEADAINNALASAGSGTNRGLSGQLAETRGEATSQDASNFQQKQDWRVKLSLAPGSTYLYNNRGNEGILLPLAETDGVIFPYTPAISVAYSAAYDGQELTHSNYKFFSYRGSAVDSISITCDFTAQDTFEANYLLAVIHFFRSVTKMFYGQDQNPKPGTPPPLCYLTGLGAFQFDEHPIAITGFTYSLPTEVDYIRAGVPTTQPGVNKRPATPPTGAGGATEARLQSSGLRPGALAPPVYFTENAGTREPTYVPTKIQMAITAVPIVTRNDISNQFSLEEYATGKLLRGSKRSGGGIW